MSFADYALGKGEYVPDERTLRISEFIEPTVPPHPTRYDFDKRRSAIPIKMWGNDAWGDCVMAGRANHLLRLERIEQRRTLPLTDELVIQEYQAESERQNGPPPPEAPNDPQDQGLVVLTAMSNWRNVGWHLDFTKRHGSQHRIYRISAYGELDPSDRAQLRQAIYFLYGIHMGFWLPRAAAKMTKGWNYNGETGPEWQPGSWGGHLVYAKKYDTDNVYVLTWGQEIPVSNSFIERYCDEAWAVVDDLDSWRARATIDVPALQKRLQGIGAKVN